MTQSFVSKTKTIFVSCSGTGCQQFWQPWLQPRLWEDMAWTSLGNIKLTRPSSAFPSSPKSPPQNHFSPQPQKHIFSSKLKPWVTLETTYKPMSKDSQCPQRVDLSWVIFTYFISEKTKCPSTESLSEEQTMWAWSSSWATDMGQILSQLIPKNWKRSCNRIWPIFLFKFFWRY